MKRLTLTTKEQPRLAIMNGVLERQWTVVEAAQLLGVSERRTWRLLAVYKEEGAAALAHGNRDRLPANTTPSAVLTQVVALARERYIVRLLTLTLHFPNIIGISAVWKPMSNDINLLFVSKGKGK